MLKGKVQVIKENETGRNILFQNTGNHEIMTLKQFINKIENRNSVYSENYYIRVQNGIKTPVSKPNNSRLDNLERRK